MEPEAARTAFDTLVVILAALAPVLVLLLGGIGRLYMLERQQRVNAEAQLSPLKRNAHIAVLEPLFEAMKATMVGRKPPRNLLERMFDANKELVLFGSDGVLKQYLDWLEETRSGVVDLEHFGGLIVGIRRSMGHPKTSITADDVLKPFVKDFAAVKASGKLRVDVEQPPRG